MGITGLQLSILSFGSWVTFHKQVDDSSADELMGIAYDKKRYLNNPLAGVVKLRGKPPSDACG